MNVNLEAMRERYRRSVPGAVDRRFPLWQETCIDVATLIDELERATNERDRWMDDYYGKKHALAEADSLETTVKFALCTDCTVNGWRPPREVHPLVDLALDVREERDRLRAELERARAERDAACVELVNERADAVVWLRKAAASDKETAKQYHHAEGLAYWRGVIEVLEGSADCIERGEHRREEGR